MKAKYTGASEEQVRWGGGSDPRKALSIGNVYDVEDVEQHSWHTRIFLSAFPGKWFNSVCFEYPIEERK